VKPHQQPPDSKLLLSPDELARELGVGRTTAYGLLWTGQIPSVTIGRLRRVRREDVDRFVAARLERGDA
jgi:excisionase family DNA binding protein